MGAEPEATSSPLVEAEVSCHGINSGVIVEQGRRRGTLNRSDTNVSVNQDDEANVAGGGCARQAVTEGGDPPGSVLPPEPTPTVVQAAVKLKKFVPKSKRKSVGPLDDTVQPEASANSAGDVAAASPKSPSKLAALLARQKAKQGEEPLETIETVNSSSILEKDGNPEKGSTRAAGDGGLQPFRRKARQVMNAARLDSSSTAGAMADPTGGSKNQVTTSEIGAGQHSTSEKPTEKATANVEVNGGLKKFKRKARTVANATALLNESGEK